MPYHEAIVTKYIGPTGYNGPRIKATSGTHSVVIPYSHELNSPGPHDEAARAIIEKHKWWGRWARGALKNRYVYVWVDDIGDTIVIE